MSKTILDIHEKILICEYKEKYPANSQQFIADHFSKLLDKKISRRTIGDIINSKERWMNLNKSLLPTKKLKSGKYEILENALLMWITQINEKHGTVTDEIIKEQAREFGKKFNIENFSYSNGWLQKFKKRNGLSQHVRHGETAAVVPDIVNAGREKLSKIIEDYPLENVYNMDESGLFYSMLPNKTISHRPEKGHKKIKNRITTIHCTNADGSDKRTLEVIGKSRSPRCFKNFRPELYVKYRYNKKAWMTISDFEDWLNSFNSKMKLQNRKVLLILDNAPCHKNTKQMSNVRVEFLPPNVTGLLQPMDAGIIKTFKTHYRRFLVKKAVKDINENRDVTITLKDAIYMAKKAWDCISPETIRNCWKHTGLIKECSSNNDLRIEEDVMEDLRITLNEAQHQLDVDMTAEEFTEIDSREPTFQNMDPDEIADFLKQPIHQPETTEDSESEFEEEEKITNKEAQNCIQKLRLYFEQNDKTNKETINMVLDIEKCIEKFAIVNKKQTTLDNYFQQCSK